MLRQAHTVLDADAHLHNVACEQNVVSQHGGQVRKVRAKWERTGQELCADTSKSENSMLFIFVDDVFRAAVKMLNPRPQRHSCSTCNMQDHTKRLTCDGLTYQRQISTVLATQCRSELL